MMAQLLARLRVLELGQGPTVPLEPGALPTVVDDTATDAELDALRRAGVQAFRASDTALYDLFV